MFFCRLGRGIAWLALLMGAFTALMGLSAAQGVDVSQYTTAKSSGAAIDQGITFIVYAAVIGTLSEIGLALSKKT